jgi:WD40 repeat protein
MWDKTTGELAGIWEGDGSVVNVIEAHPFLPTVAVSGIDNTVKLFESSPEPTGFSRLSDAEQITEQNSRPERTTRYNLQMLALLQYGIRAQILPPTTQADDCRIM